MLSKMNPSNIIGDKFIKLLDLIFLNLVVYLEVLKIL